MFEKITEFLKKHDDPYRVVGYAIEEDKIYVQYHESNYSILPKNTHNLNILDRDIINHINQTYDTFMIIKKSIKFSLSLQIAFLLFSALVSKDMLILSLLFNLLTLPIIIQTFKRTLEVLTLIEQEKYVLENIDLINQFITEEDVKCLSSDARKSYEISNHTIHPGNLISFDDSIKVLTKRIHKVKNGK